MHAQRGAHAIANDVDRGAEAATTATQGLLTCWSVLWSTSGTRMRPHTRAVHDPVFHIWVLGTVCPQALPHAPVAPARTGVYTRFPVPYAAGRTRPLRPPSVDPPHGVHKAPARAIISAEVRRWVGSHTRPAFRPVLVGQVHACYTTTVPAVTQMSPEPK